MDLCSDCGLTTRNAKFCPATGILHKPPATRCELCGLTSQFCAETGKPHAVDAKPETQQLRRRTAAGGDDNWSEGALEEALVYSKSSARIKRAQCSWTQEQRDAIEAFGQDGFGIFAPGNPALTKMTASPSVSDADVSTESVAMPDKVLEDVFKAMKGDVQRNAQPRWIRKLRPAMRGAAFAFAIIVGLAVLQIIALQLSSSNASNETAYFQPTRTLPFVATLKTDEVDAQL
jgi:hypothetical protein